VYVFHHRKFLTLEESNIDITQSFTGGISKGLHGDVNMRSKPNVLNFFSSRPISKLKLSLADKLLHLSRFSNSMFACCILAFVQNIHKIGCSHSAIGFNPWFEISVSVLVVGFWYWNKQIGLVVSTIPGIILVRVISTVTSIGPKYRYRVIFQTWFSPLFLPLTKFLGRSVTSCIQAANLTVCEAN